MTQNLLEIRQLSVYYDQFRALRDLTIDIGEGEVVALIGANGAGKSSLLKAVIGQVPRLTGEITFSGKPISRIPTSEIVKAGIALVPEGRRLFPSLSVAENLQIGMNIGRRGPHSLATIQKLFPILAEKRNEKAHHLSGGQQQMVAIGRALLCNPRLLLCDEISLGLAPIVIDQIYAAIPRIREAGTSIVLVEQDVSRSLAVSDRFYCLLEGEISLHGKPLETTQASVTAAYFGLERHR